MRHTPPQAVRFLSEKGNEDFSGYRHISSLACCTDEDAHSSILSGR